jgi:hypothetical protein
MRKQYFNDNILYLTVLVIEGTLDVVDGSIRHTTTLEDV